MTTELCISPAVKAELCGCKKYFAPNIDLHDITFALFPYKTELCSMHEAAQKESFQAKLQKRLDRRKAK